MTYISQIFFIILLGFAIWLFVRNMKRLISYVKLGKPNWPNDQPQLRWRRVLLNALGQKKMFKRPVPAVLHFFVYAGFIIINIEILEIILDGILGTHRLFAQVLGSLYAPFISFFEFLGLSVLIGCAIFLVRRNILRIKRLNMPELNRWPKIDANTILIAEISLMTLFLTLNTTDQILQSRGEPHFFYTGKFFFTAFFIPLFNGLSTSALIIIERICWWGHIIGILAFLNYLYYSKHLHILFAFPNTWYSKLEPQGKMINMPEIQKEVAMMLDPSLTSNEPPAEPGRFGAKDVYDLKTTDLLGAFSCTECGRCTAVCPANITGKKLSPRKIMMDTRDRCEEIGRGRDKQGKDYKDEKSLLGDYITHEEIFACTTCQACVEACPVNIDPLNIIMQLRRYAIMEESQAPGNWNTMFTSTENNQAPWQFSPMDRGNWALELENEK